jgi:UDP-N-acetylglucosamine--N-acetylmuramyl-(pentapeptide) pyrophosphoryl-undecaprenol N-acetylglucosamine transferase
MELRTESTTESTTERGAGRTLLVASTGGHLDELVRLAPRFSPCASDVEWVTHPGPQAEDLLRGQRVHLVPYVAPRDVRHAAMNLIPALRILRRGHWDRVVTTGAGVALPFVAVARMLGIPCVYVESATRLEGPSLTGSLLSRVPGVELCTQQPTWADERWDFRGSVFDGFEAQHRPVAAPARRVVVMLGTSPYAFRSAVDAVLRTLPQVSAPEVEVTWQVGGTEVDPLSLPAGARVSVSLPAAELQARVAEADLVIAHAGVGSALTALGAGRRPVLLPRQVSAGEHVDDHQSQIAADLHARGLAVGVRPEDLTAEHLQTALASRVVSTQGGPFVLTPHAA